MNISRYFVSICLSLSFASAREFELVSVEVMKNKETLEVKQEYKSITCSFELNFSLESGKNILAIRLSNSSDKPAKISKLLLGLDESYKLIYDNKILSNAFNNHQANKELEIYREKLGFRWLIIPAKGSTLISLDPTSWQALEDLSVDHKEFQVELSSNLFDSQKVLLRFKAML